MKKCEQDSSNKHQHAPESGDSEINVDENLRESADIQQTPREELSYLQSVDFNGDALDREVTNPLENQDDNREACTKNITQPPPTKEARDTIVQTDLINEPEISVTRMKNNGSNLESSVVESEHHLKYELSCTDSKSNEMKSFTIQITSLQDLLQHHITIWSHAKNSMKDINTTDKLKSLRNNLLSVIEYIDDAVKDREKIVQANSLIFDKASTSTNQHKLSNTEKSDQKLGKDLFTCNQISEPSTSHHAKPENISTSSLHEPHTTSISTFELNEDNTSTPVNKNTIIIPKRLFLLKEGNEKDSEDEISSIKSYTGSDVKEKNSILSLNLWSNQVNSFNSIKTGESSSSNNLEIESTSAMVNSQSTLESVDFEKAANSTLDEDNIHGFTSEPTQFELDISIHEEDTIASVYQSALYDLDSTSSFKDFKSIYLDANDVLLSENSQRKSLVEEKDDTVTSELLVSEIEGSIQDETDIESSLSESISQDLKSDENKITLTQASKDSQETMLTAFDVKKSDLNSNATTDSVPIIVLFDSNRINPLQNVEDFRPSPPDNYNEPCTSKKQNDAPLKDYIYYYEPEWILGLPEPFLYQENDIKDNDKVLQQVEDDQLSTNYIYKNTVECKNNKFLSGSFGEYKTPLEQKSCTSAQLELSTLSDFDYQSLEEMKVVHSTPIKKDKLKITKTESASMYSEVSKEDDTQQKKSCYKSYQKLESSSFSEDQLSDKFKIILEDTEAQMNWVWLPAHVKNLVLPSPCCYHILPIEDTHSESSSRYDKIEQATVQTSIKNPNDSIKLTAKDVQIGPDLNLEFKQLELNKTFDIPKRQVIAIGDQPELESKKTSEASEPVESKSILVKQHENKGWENNEYSASFLTLDKMIYGFYDLFDAQCFAPASTTLSTIYEVSELDNNITNEPIYMDARQPEKIRQYVESLTQARLNESLYYSLRSVTTCTSENPYTLIGEFFVQGKYKLTSDKGLENNGSTVKLGSVSPRFTEPTSTCYLPLIPEENTKDLEKIIEKPEKVSEKNIIFSEDTDLLTFCKQEIEKFPTDKLGIRFKQIIKYNGQILFDCRCNYGQLPSKLRRKYEVPDYLLLEFHHLLIPNQRKLYFSFHCCKHTIHEMQQILKITGKHYMDANIVKVIMQAYRCSYVKCQLAHVPKDISENSSQFNIGESNSKDEFIQSEIHTMPDEEQKKWAPISSTEAERIFEESSVPSQNEDDVINLLDLEESMNLLLHQLPSRHTLPDDNEEDIE